MPAEPTQPVHPSGLFSLHRNIVAGPGLSFLYGAIGRRLLAGAGRVKARLGRAAKGPRANVRVSPYGPHHGGGHQHPVMPRHARIASFNTAIIRAISRWPAARGTALRSNLGDTGYQPAWRIPANLNRCCQPDDLKRTEFGQGEAHLFDAFRG